MKKLYAALLALVLAAGLAHAADEKVFDLHENFSSCSQSSTYDREYTTVWTSSSYSGIALYNYSISYYNDFLTTPDIELHAGTEYVVKTTLAAYDSYYNAEAKLNILLGQGEDPEQFRVLKALESTETQYTASPQEVSFMVPESGNYRLSFQGTKALKLLNTALWDRGASTVPAPPADFTLTPDPDGAVKVDISFTVPGTTLTGQDLDACSYRLFRGVQKIKEAAAAKGEKVTFSETRGEAGNLTYAVEVVAGDQTSERLSGIVYLGPETPSAPADIVLSYADGLYNLSWAAPVKGIHDAPLDPARLTYTVSRILDGESTVVAANISATSFSEAIEPAGLQTLKYAVTAKYAAPALESAAAESAPLRIGSLALPFADSFAGATMSDLWENVCVSKPKPTDSDKFWEAKATSTSSGDATAPADNDGGFLFYNSYSIQRGYSTRLITPPFAFSEGDKPTLSFMKWNRANYTRYNDKLYIQLSLDNGEWINVPEAEFTPGGEPAGEWSSHTVSFADLIPGGTKSFRVAFYIVSDYGNNLMIDCVRLFNQVDKDLEISSATIEESLLAGNEATLLVKVTNNGTSEVPADGYSLEVISDFPALIALPELEAIPSLGSKEYAIAIPVNSVHILNADSFSFQAKVSMAGDEVPANDLSAEASLAVAHSEGTPASGLTAAMQPDKSVLLSWTPAKDLEYEPVNIIEDFDDETFTDDSTGPFNGWTIVDIDGKNGGTWYTASGSTFNITSGGTPSGSTGKFLGCTVASNAQQDDWIISPAIDCKAGSEMGLKAKVALRSISSYGNNYKIELLYSTEEDFNILNPADNFTASVRSVTSTSYSDRVLPQDNKWHEISFEGIPAEAKRIALHFAAKGSYTPAMWVDDIRLTETDNNPLLGYHIYDVNAADKLNSELIGADETSFTLPAAPEARLADGRPVFVSAVYADGEAHPSNILNLAEVTGIEAVSVEKADSADARWYNLQGIEMHGTLAPGIYIRRTASSATKVIVR